MPKVDGKFTLYYKFEELIKYSKTMLMKFPKSERYALNTHILNNLYDSLECLIFAYKHENKKIKLENLTKIDVKMSVLKTNIKLAYSFKYISAKNFMNWNNQVENICKMMGGWIKSCQKESI